MKGIRIRCNHTHVHLHSHTHTSFVRLLCLFLNNTMFFSLLYVFAQVVNMMFDALTSLWMIGLPGL